MSIKAVCHTNLDEFKHVAWPTKFVAVPQKGDCVAGVRTGGGGPGTHPELYVAGVTHKMEDPRKGGRVLEGEPYILVELHRPSWWTSLDGKPCKRAGDP